MQETSELSAFADAARREGIADKHKRIYRMYREERLQVRQRQRFKQRLVRSSEFARRRNARRRLHFVRDWKVNGRSRA